MKKNIFLPFICLIIFVGCQKSQDKINIEKYFPLAQNYCLKDSVKMDSEEIKHPVEMSVYNNTLFLRNFNGPHFVSIFDSKTGKFIKDIITQGVGPKEFIMINSFSVDDKGIHFFNLVKGEKVCIQYTKQDFSDIIFDVLPIEKKEKELCTHSYLFPLKSGKYFTLGLYDKHRSMLIDSTGKISKGFGQYPNIEEYAKFSNTALAMGNQAVASSSVDGSYIAIANKVGGIVQIYNLKNDVPQLENEHIYHPSYFVDHSDANIIRVAYDEEKNINGALGIAYHKNFIMVLFSGKDIKSNTGNKLLVYTEKGDPIKCITLDKECLLFSIDPISETAYFLSPGNEENYTIYKLHIQEIIKD